MKLLQTLLAATALTTSLAAGAHEFWMWADPFFPKVGAEANMTLHVGEYFKGVLTGFAPIDVAAVRRYSRGKREAWQPGELPNTTLPGLELTFSKPGTHMVSYDSHFNQVVLPADKFTAYLHEEGLDAIIRQREKSGTSATPGRERYWRCVKTLLRVGGKSDATHALDTGQRFEIIPLSDPFAKTSRRTGLDLGSRLINEMSRRARGVGATYGARLLHGHKL